MQLNSTRLTRPNRPPKTATKLHPPRRFWGTAVRRQIGKKPNPPYAVRLEKVLQPAPTRPVHTPNVRTDCYMSFVKEGHL